MPEMVMREKKNRMLSDQEYQQVFRTADPFDQLIMELGHRGVLNVCVVSIRNKPKNHPS